MRLFLLRFFVACMLVPGLAWPQALPSVVQRAVSGIIQQKMIKRGFAANDPRFGATIASAGSSIAGAAVGAAVVTAAGVTAPAWVTVGATVALGGLFAVGIDLAADATIRWLFKPDGSVENGHTEVPAGTQARIAIGTVPISTVVANSIGTPFMVIWYQNPTYFRKTYMSTPTYTNPDSSTYVTYQTSSYNGKTYWVWESRSTASTTPCPGGYTFTSGECVADGQPVPVSPSTAVAGLTQEQLAKPVNPQVLADIADAAWRKASQEPGYSGVPYDAANPITRADVEPYKAANPATWPTVGDVVKPQQPQTGGAVGDPFKLPAPDAATGTPGGSGGSGTPIDWTILAPPDQIPTSSVSPSYTPTLFASATGCPAPENLTIYGTTYGISWQPFCDLMGTLAPIFLFFGAAAAAFIFAEAFKP